MSMSPSTLLHILTLGFVDSHSSSACCSNFTSSASARTQRLRGVAFLLSILIVDATLRLRTPSPSFIAAIIIIVNSLSPSPARTNSNRLPARCLQPRRRVCSRHGRILVWNQAQQQHRAQQQVQMGCHGGDGRIWRWALEWALWRRAHDKRCADKILDQIARKTNSVLPHLPMIIQVLVSPDEFEDTRCLVYRNFPSRCCSGAIAFTKVGLLYQSAAQ